ncbi:MAG: MBL fold metallo-hydrolase [Geodermatophilaceae bacterium]|nr:MBL fold metallo-hydrolase [Geodermatophilaceae bacterium]
MQPTITSTTTSHTVHVPAEDSLLFIGTATVLIRYAGMTILTDPNFIHAGERVPIGYGLMSRRRTDPALDIERLPQLDAVVLSHLHGDHFDRVAEQGLDRDVPLLAPPSAATVLDRRGFRATEGLRTWQSTHVDGGTGGSLTVTALPGRHAARLIAPLFPSVMSSLLEFQPAADSPAARPLRIYISGDSLVDETLRRTRERVGPIDLAILHLGGTRILGIKLTMDGRDGVEALRMLTPRFALPVHYDDYPVFRSPLSDFQQEVEAAGLGALVRSVGRGETLPLVFEPTASELAVAAVRAAVGDS